MTAGRFVAGDASVQGQVGSSCLLTRQGSVLWVHEEAAVGGGGCLLLGEWVWALSASVLRSVLVSCFSESPYHPSGLHNQAGPASCEGAISVPSGAAKMG